MIALAEAILKGARARDESRGAHYKPDFPERDDERLSCTPAFARYDAARDEAFVEKGPIDISLIPPRKRTYGKVEDAVKSGGRRRTHKQTVKAETVSGNVTQSSNGPGRWRRCERSSSHATS